MANSLHFYRDKEKVLRHIRKYLKWNGALLLVEYNVDSGKPLRRAPGSASQNCWGKSRHVF